MTLSKPFLMVALSVGIILASALVLVFVPPDPPLRCSGLEATIAGTDGSDRLQGTDEGDVMVGGDGDDSLSGGGGVDLICGGEGDDLLDGGDGKDALIGNAGDDSLDGGDGTDVGIAGDGDDTCSDIETPSGCEGPSR